MRTEWENKWWLSFADRDSYEQWRYNDGGGPRTELPGWTMELVESNTARSWQRIWPVARAEWDWYSLVEAETKGSNRTRQLKGKELCWLAMKWVAEDCVTWNERNINIESIFIILARHTPFSRTISRRKQRSPFQCSSGTRCGDSALFIESSNQSRSLVHSAMVTKCFCIPLIGYWFSLICHCALIWHWIHRVFPLKWPWPGDISKSECDRTSNTCRCRIAIVKQYVGFEFHKQKNASMNICRLAHIISFSSVSNQSSNSASWLLTLCELFLPRRLINMRRIKGFRSNLRAIHCHNRAIQIHKRWKRNVRHGDCYRWHVCRLKGEIHIRRRNRGKERTFIAVDQSSIGFRDRSWLSIAEWNSMQVTIADPAA